MEFIAFFLGRGIGFLADMRRMNVGLTRAKCSLFVLGHARSLSRSEYWGDLVRDAEKRSLVREVRKEKKICTIKTNDCIVWIPVFSTPYEWIKSTSKHL